MSFYKFLDDAIKKEEDGGYQEIADKLKELKNIFVRTEVIEDKNK